MRDRAEMAAELAEVLAPDGETVDPAEEMALPEEGAELADGQDEPPRRRWRVDSDERADYACRRAMIAEEEIARLRAFADQQKEQIDRWLAERVEPLESTRAFFVGSAIDYARRLRMADDRFRSLPLPCGWKLTAYDRRAGVDVADGDRFCTWALALEHDDVVNVTMKPKLREVAKRYAVTPDGSAFFDPETSERVPGVAPRAAGWSADAKPPKGGGDDDDGDDE